METFFAGNGGLSVGGVGQLFYDVCVCVCDDWLTRTSGRTRISAAEAKRVILQFFLRDRCRHICLDRLLHSVHHNVLVGS